MLISSFTFAQSTQWIGGTLEKAKEILPVVEKHYGVKLKPSRLNPESGAGRYYWKDTSGKVIVRIWVETNKKAEGLNIIKQDYVSSIYITSFADITKELFETYFKADAKKDEKNEIGALYAKSSNYWIALEDSYELTKEFGVPCKGISISRRD